MSFIPDTRHKTKECYPYCKHPEEENPYWQGYLGDDDVNTVIGYDFAVQDCLCFFDNLSPETDKITQEKIDEMKQQFVISAECKRDEFIVSMLDGMDEEEYKKIVAAVKAGERKNYCTELDDPENGAW